MPMHSPAHPGAMLREAMGTKFTIKALADHIGVTRPYLSNLVNGKLAITPRLALLLGDAFPDLDAEYWMRLQATYDLAELRREKSTRRVKPMRALATAQ